MFVQREKEGGRGRERRESPRVRTREDGEKGGMVRLASEQRTRGRLPSAVVVAAEVVVVEQQ